MTLSQVPRELAERLITRRNVRYTPHHVHHAEYFVYACGYLLWQCNDESTADKIHDEALAKAEAVIREAMQKAQPQWISVEEKLPEDGEQVLTSQVRANGERITATSHYAHDNKPEYRWYVEDQGFAIQPVVTHWMPLPEPPKAVASSLTEQETTK